MAVTKRASWSLSAISGAPRAHCLGVPCYFASSACSRRCPCLCALVALQASSFISWCHCVLFAQRFILSYRQPSTLVHRLFLPSLFAFLRLIHIFGLFSDLLRSSSVGAFLPCLMVCFLASSSGDMPSLLSHEIFLGKVDVNPGIARFLAVQSYVPESYFISMVASHTFK